MGELEDVLGSVLWELVEKQSCTISIGQVFPPLPNMNLWSVFLTEGRGGTEALTVVSYSHFSRVSYKYRHSEL